jgi:cysteine synthase
MVKLSVSSIILKGDYLMKESLASKLERLDKISAEFTGNTPLIEVTDDKREGARIFAKLEWHNMLSFSLKDRGACSMLKAAIKEADSKGKDRVHALEYTGGSQGVALSILGGILDIPMTLIVPGAVAESFAKQLTLYGARVIRTEAEKGFLATIQKAEEMAQKDEDISLLHQQHNLANLEAFEEGMAGEILSQLQEMGINRVDAWTASVGSGGTLIGVYKGLVQTFPAMKMYCITPKEMPYGTEQAPNSKPKLYGSGGIGYGMKQKFIEPLEEKIAGHFYYSLEEAYQGMADYYKKTGMLIGSSTAANLMAAQTIARDLDKDKVVVIAFPALAIQRDIQNLKNYL